MSVASRPAKPSVISKRVSPERSLVIQPTRIPSPENNPGTGSVSRPANAQKDVTDQETALNTHMALVQQRYLKQFNALDSLMSTLQQTSNYLTQQLANSAKIGNGG